MQPTRQIPHSREAEEAVVGAVMINPNCLIEDNLLALLADTDFYIHRHQWIWGAYRALFNKRIEIDLLTVCEELDKMGQLVEVGGSAYITSLINQVPSSLNAHSYAQIVKTHSERREGIHLANSIATAAYDESVDFSISQTVAQYHKPQILSRRVTTWDAYLNLQTALQNLDYLSTGMSGLDAKLGGLFKQELSVWGGYQGTGKTASFIQCSCANAKLGRRVLMCSLEMNDFQIWLRMACGKLKVDPNQVRSGKVSQEVKDRVLQVAEDLAAQYADNFIIYNGPMTPTDILAATIAEKPDLVFVDTLKNVKGKPSRMETREWYDFVLEFLRSNVAKAEDTHVGVLHHINRSATKEGNRPTKHDLMFAGESDADTVIILHRPENKGKPEHEYTPPGQAYVEYIVDKSRFGWTGIHESRFILNEQRFYSISRDVQVSPE